MRRSNPPAASKHPCKDFGEPRREKRHASTTASAKDVSPTDEYGSSPLHLAVIEGDLKKVRELIERGADTRLQDRWGLTPLHTALAFKEEAAAELLAAADCSNDVQDEFKRTPLHRAAMRGYVTIIRNLLSGGSRTRVQDEWGMTPLHCALLWRRGAAAELLAEADSNIDVQDRDGCTPLHRAAKNEFQGIVRKLLQSGMNPHITDRSGEYPIQTALRRMNISLRRDENIPKMLVSMCALKGIAIDWAELQLQEKDLQFCIEKVSRCDAEIQLMKCTRVPGSSISHHHLVTRHVCWVASRLQRESVQGVSRSVCARQDFPVYADLIASKLQMADERRVWIDRCLECFSLLSLPLPLTFADIVLFCLSNGDMGNLVRAFRLES